MQLARLWYVFLALVVALTGLWWLSLAPGAFTGDFWLTRKTLVMGTGVLAFGLMSVGVILAARPVWFETPLGGSTSSTDCTDSSASPLSPLRRLIGSF